jgi:hypothetical protein
MSIIDQSPDPSPLRPLKKKKKKFINITYESTEEEKPILLVTRKKSTIKSVPLDNNAYPYDLKAKRQHIKALVNF